MHRFAVLRHDHPFPHWDLLLETGDRCRTWRLLAEPGPGRTVPAEPIADHRPHYLTYEGRVSGGRGTVACWDAGTFDRANDTSDGLEVVLAGDRLRGRCLLTTDVNGGATAAFA